MRPSLAVELLDVVGAGVEEVAVVGFLVTGREAAEDEDVFVRDLVEPAAFQADPVRVLLYPQVQRLPVLPPLNVIFLNEVGPLAAVEASDDIESLVVEGDCRVEIAPRVQAGHLGPGVAAHIVHFTLVHRLTR